MTVGQLVDRFTAHWNRARQRAAQADRARRAQAVKRIKLDNMTVEQLVERFVATALDQDRALFHFNNARYNHLYDQMEAVEHELKRRAGHPNAQVRLKAMKATLAVAPERARRMLKIIAGSREYPQAGDAGMTIDSLDRGFFKPN